MSDFDLVVTGRVVTTDRVIDDGYVAVRDGVVELVGSGAPPAAAETQRFGNAFVLPGAIDAQVHSRSQKDQEDFVWSTRSAAAGGVTTIVDMPYDDGDLIATPERLRAKAESGAAQARVDFALYATLQPRDGAELVDGLVAAGAAAFKFSLFETHPERFPRVPPHKLVEIPAIDGDRIWADIMALAAITDPAQPFTRRSFTPRFREGRAWLATRFVEAGLDVHLDAVGNLSGRRGAPSARTILVGSHTDTVPGGGRFDGIAGVAAALEMARALAGRHLNHAMEVVDYLAEEPSVFGLSCIGSRAMAGKLDDTMLALTGPDGGTLAEAIRSVGGVPERIPAARRRDVAMALELHIEQGRVLESAGVTLGIVSAIVGIARVEIRYEGAADHAGTTPMDLRRDAMVPAAETIAAVSALAREYAATGHGHFVATTGVVEVTPNAANVVPGAVRLIVEARAETAERLEAFLVRLAAISRDTAMRHRVERPVFRTLSRTDPVACDAHLRTLLRDAAHLRGISTMDMASGAGHDTAFIAGIAPAAMVFVPSRDGRSHTSEEWSDRETIAAGAEAMLGALLAFEARPIHRE